MIKIKNIRKEGSLFHYAHFICDCLFPEIVCDIFKYSEVIREKTIEQTIGNFNKIYTDVMLIKNTELPSSDFQNLNINTIFYKNKENFQNKIYFEKFRNYIFTRYNINYLEYDNNYPEVILIKRSDRINLIDDDYLKKINTNVSNGKERREIKDIIYLEKYLENKYIKNKKTFKSLYFENLLFEDQVKYFNNAKLIICAHGAVMSNLFFCKKNTTVVEVTCGFKWKFFDTITNILKLKHIKCDKNNLVDIIKCIDTI